MAYQPPKDPKHRHAGADSGKAAKRWGHGVQKSPTQRERSTAANPLRRQWPLRSFSISNGRSTISAKPRARNTRLFHQRQCTAPAAATAIWTKFVEAQWMAWPLGQADRSFATTAKLLNYGVKNGTLTKQSCRVRWSASGWPDITHPSRLYTRTQWTFW